MNSKISNVSGYKYITLIFDIKITAMIPKKQAAAIKNWDVSDRPREKMNAQGISVLSNAELIAVLIGSGSRKESALELAKRILAHCQHRLHALAQLNLEQLQQFEGIGAAKACSIVTALELGKRSVSEKGLKQKKITCSRDVFDLMCPQIGTLKYEEFWALYLNNSNKILKKIKLSKGGLVGTVVDVRMVFKNALELFATGIVLCHNHPSGGSDPSAQDKQITQKLKRAGETMDIKILDHLIITEKAYFSFADAQLI
jgi:DNA repair protein RadC